MHLVKLSHPTFLKPSNVELTDTKNTDVMYKRWKKWQVVYDKKCSNSHKDNTTVQRREVLIYVHVSACLLNVFLFFLINGSSMATPRESKLEKIQ